ncbi:hypothetical protein FRB95_014662 [Tulasnella sp. JGI-2019a]|nr:hypothetical protein FRB95_014662 [Tulasnella sp. JGI-2019a]
MYLRAPLLSAVIVSLCDFVTDSKDKVVSIQRHDQLASPSCLLTQRPLNCLGILDKKDGILKAEASHVRRSCYFTFASRRVYILRKKPSVRNRLNIAAQMIENGAFWHRSSQAPDLSPYVAATPVRVSLLSKLELGPTTLTILPSILIFQLSAIGQPSLFLVSIESSFF